MARAPGTERLTAMVELSTMRSGGSVPADEHAGTGATGSPSRVPNLLRPAPDVA